MPWSISQKCCNKLHSMRIMLRKTTLRQMAWAIKSTTPSCRPTLALSHHRALSSQSLQQHFFSAPHAMNPILPSRRQFHTSRANLLALPSHTVMPMPALSPVSFWVLSVKLVHNSTSACSVQGIVVSSTVSPTRWKLSHEHQSHHLVRVYANRMTCTQLNKSLSAA